MANPQRKSEVNLMSISYSSFSLAASDFRGHASHFVQAAPSRFLCKLKNPKRSFIMSSSRSSSCWMRAFAVTKTGASHLCFTPAPFLTSQVM